MSSEVAAEGGPESFEVGVLDAEEEVGGNFGGAGITNQNSATKRGVTPSACPWFLKFGHLTKIGLTPLVLLPRQRTSEPPDQNHLAIVRALRCRAVVRDVRTEDRFPAAVAKPADALLFELVFGERHNLWAWWLRPTEDL